MLLAPVKYTSLLTGETFKTIAEAAKASASGHPVLIYHADDMLHGVLEPAVIPSASGKSLYGFVAENGQQFWNDGWYPAVVAAENELEACRIFIVEHLAIKCRGAIVMDSSSWDDEHKTSLYIEAGDATYYCYKVSVTEESHV